MILITFDILLQSSKIDNFRFRHLCQTMSFLEHPEVEVLSLFRRKEKKTHSEGVVNAWPYHCVRKHPTRPVKGLMLCVLKMLMLVLDEANAKSNGALALIVVVLNTRAYERGVQEVHRTWARKDEIAHAKFFCKQSQNYYFKKVVSITTYLFPNLNMVAVLSISWLL